MNLQQKMLEFDVSYPWSLWSSAGHRSGPIVFHPRGSRELACRPASLSTSVSISPSQGCLLSYHSESHSRKWSTDRTHLHILVLCTNPGTPWYCSSSSVSLNWSGCPEYLGLPWYCHIWRNFENKSSSFGVSEGPWWCESTTTLVLLYSNDTASLSAYQNN